MTVDPGTLGAIRAGVAAELDLLKTARAAIALGEAPPIDELDRRIATLCQAAQSLPQDEARSLAPEFEQLQASLDELAAELWSAMRRNKGARIFPFQLGRP